MPGECTGAQHWHRAAHSLPLLWALSLLNQLSGDCWGLCGLARGVPVCGVLAGSPDGMDLVPNTGWDSQSGLCLLKIQVSPVQICHSGPERWVY